MLLKGWLSRPLLAVAAAVLVAWLVAVFEALHAANEWQIPIRQIIIGDEHGGGDGEQGAGEPAS